MALKLGELVTFLKTDNSGLRRGLAEGKAETAAAGDQMSRSMASTAASVAREWLMSWRRTTSESRQAHRQLQLDIATTQARLRQLATEYGRTRDKSLVDQMDQARNHLAQLQRAAADLGAGLVATAGQVGAGMASMGSSIFTVIGIVLLLAAALSVLEISGLAVGGMLGALPGLATGALAAIATLVLGIWGLGDAFRDTARSGGSAADRARQLVLAERALAAANRETAAAQNEVNRARADAAERMEDLVRSLAGARLDEESAIQAVADAQRDLDRARLTEDPATIGRADLAYRQAVHRLAEVQDRVGDLAAEQADQSARGVEGSDEVTAALERQRRAVEAVSDAQYELERARRPGSGGAAKDVTEIAASAQATVAAIKSLGPTYSQLRLTVQQAMFEGLDAEVLGLSAAWEPTLRARLTSMAGMVNGLTKNWSKTSRDPAFIADISAGWVSVERLIDRIGRSITGPGLEAFGRLARGAEPMLDAIGDGLGDIIDGWAEWIEKADNSGALHQFFEDAGAFFRGVLTTGGDVMSILGSIIAIMIGTDKDKRESALAGHAQTLHDLAAWLGDPANQAAIRDWLEDLTALTWWIRDDAIPAISGMISWVGGLIDAVNRFPGSVQRAVNGVWDPLWLSFKTNANKIIAAWNGLKLTIGGGTFLGQPIPSMTFQTEKIQYLAKGAWIPPTPGGQLAVMAEAGQPEWALPDDKLQAALDEAVRRGTAGNDGASLDGTVIENHIHIGDEVVKVTRQVISDRDRRTKRRVTAGVGTR